MSAEISFDTKAGKFRMYALDGIPVWHNSIGTRLKRPPASVEELLEAASLKYRVETRPVFRKDGDGKFVKLPDAAETVLVEEDRHLGTVSPGFVPVQNQECAEIAWALGQNGVEFVTAGALFDGRQTWILARTPEVFEVAGQRHEQYVCVGNGHDGSRALTIFGTDVTVVCKNTFTSAEASAKNILRIVHKAGAAQATVKAIEVLKRLKESHVLLDGRLQKLAVARVNSKERDAYFDAVAAARGGSAERQIKFAAVLGNRWRDGLGQEERGPTLLRAWNAVTDAVDHVVRPAVVDGPQRNRDRKMVAAMFGEGATVKRAALKLALDYVGADSSQN